MRLVLSAFFSLVFSSLCYSATNVSIDSVTGSIPRGSTAQSFDLQIKLSGITKAVTGSDHYANRLQIIIREVNTNTTIPFSDAATSTTVDLKGFTLSFIKEDFKLDNGLNSGTVYLRVKSTKLAATIGTADHLTLDVSYVGDEGTVKKEGVEIDKEKGVADEAPTGVSFDGTFKTVIATYSAASTITFTAGGSKAPTGVSLYLAKKGQGTITVDATVHDPAADSDTGKTTCEINTDAADGESCVTCKEVSGDPSYINTDKLPSTVIFTSSANEGKVSVTDLEEVDYIGFLTYQPDGVKQSECFAASPQRNYTWSELTDPDESATLKDPRCFIATAAFGSPLNRYVETFRRFRDAHLLTTWWGKVLVETYYFISPPMAWVIDHSPTLKSMAQMILLPMAEHLEAK